MRAFIISILMVSVIAINAEVPSKKLEKRGVLQNHGYSSGGLTSGGFHGSLGVAAHGNYLPPVPSVSVVKKPYSVPLPAPTYGVPSFGHSAPASTYGVPSLSAAPVYATSVGVHSQVPVYSGHVAAPVPTYGAPSYAPPSSYGVPASVGPVALGAGSLSTSYGVPSTAGISLGSASFPSKTYGVPSSVGVTGGLSVGHLGVHGGTHNAPQVVHGGHAADLSVSLPAPSYGVPHHDAHVGHSDGYSYPVPSNKLFD